MEIRIVRDICLGILLGLPAVLCGQSSGPAGLTQLLAIGGEKGGSIYQWQGIAVDDEDNIYLTDQMDYSLKKFNRGGHLVAAISKKGREPGAFMTPTGVRFLRGLLYVSQRTVSGIQVFASDDLAFIRRIPYPFPVTAFAVVSDNDLMLASLGPGSPPALTSVDSLGRVLRVRKADNRGKPSGHPLLDSFSFCLTANRDIIIVHEWRDLIRKQDLSGTALWQASLFGGLAAETKVIAGLQLPARIMYKSVALDSSGRIYVLAGHYASNPGRDIFVLDEDGSEVGRLTLPESSHMIYIDGRDRLYARSRQGTAVVKYRIDEGPPRPENNETGGH